MIYYARKDWPTVYAMSAKAGCTSLQKALKPQGFVKIDEPDGRPVLQVVRHPLERLVSAWAFFRNYPAGPGRYINTHTTFPEFVQITEERDDVHWAPQQPAGDSLIRLEHLDEAWPSVGVGVLERHRTSEHAPWQSYYSAELAIRCAERYAADLALWTSAQRPSQPAAADAAPACTTRSGAG